MVKVEFISLQETAKRYSLDEKTIRRLVQTGRFPAARKMGRVLRFRVSDLEHFDEKGRADGRIYN